jgi:3-methyladenine DNA glycosylase AlkC
MNSGKEKGAASISAVTEELRQQLELGLTSSKTLSELLAIDLSHVVKNVFGGDLQFPDPKPGIVGRMLFAGEWVASQGLIEVATSHPSDIVRGFVPYAIASKNLPLQETFDLIRPFAADHHFGVREWAWLAVRPRVGSELEDSVRALGRWVVAPEDSLRRFASEVTRPRGVWCSHIKSLKDRPEQGLSILEPLRSDPSQYVQDSVANWLNDAGKSRPDWVQQICGRWRVESPTTQTAYIVKRALRNFK